MYGRAGTAQERFYLRVTSRLDETGGELDEEGGGQGERGEGREESAARWKRLEAAGVTGMKVRGARGWMGRDTRDGGTHGMEGWWQMGMKEGARIVQG